MCLAGGCETMCLAGGCETIVYMCLAGGCGQALVLERNGAECCGGRRVSFGTYTER